MLNEVAKKCVKCMVVDMSLFEEIGPEETLKYIEDLGGLSMQSRFMRID